MAIIGRISILMALNAAGLTKGVGLVRAELNMMSRSFGGLALAAAGFAAVTVAAIGKAVLSASNLEEQTDLTRDQFGKFASQVIDQSNLLADAFGMTKAKTLEAASAFSGMFEGAGFAGKAVADLSVHFVKLGADLSRARNIDIDEALLKLQSGLSGEEEPLRRYGIDLHETHVKSVAAANGIGHLGQMLTESEKKTARMIIINEGLTKSWGNMAKTGDKTAGAIQGLQGRTENAFAAIGESMLHIAAPALEELQIGIAALQNWWLSSADAGVRATDLTVAGVDKAGNAVGFLQKGIGNLANMWQVVQIAFTGMQGVVITGLNAIFKTLMYVTNQYVKLLEWATGTRGSNGKSEGEFAQFGKWLQSQEDATAKQAWQQLSAPWKSEDVDKAFAEERKKRDEARAKLSSQGKLDINKFRPTNAPNELLKPKHDKQFADAETYGSKEGANILIQSMYGGTKPTDAAIAQTAQNTARSNVLLEAIRQQFAQQVGINVLNGF
jgi:hypothetical protein